MFEVLLPMSGGADWYQLVECENVDTLLAVIRALVTAERKRWSEVKIVLRPEL